MNGMRAMLIKEGLEIRCTSRKWVLPGILVACAVIAPLLTYYLPRIAPGQDVDATVLGACTTFLSLLSSLAILSIVSATSGIVSTEVRSGTAVLVVTKPVSRAAFVLAKVISQCLVVVAATLIATLVFAVLSYALFETLPFAHLLAAIGVWLSLAMFYTVLMVVLSAAITSQSLVGGIGVAVYIALTIMNGISPFKTTTPAGVGRAVADLVQGSESAWLWPTVTSLVLVAVLASLSGVVFARREL
jgi:ABC-2 type transport system permease protein